MVARVDEVLGVVDDLDGRAAIHGQLNTILGRLGILDDLLRAVGVDDDRHRAAVDVLDRDLDLGPARVLGQLDLDGRSAVAALARLNLGRDLDRLAGLLCVLDRLLADLGLRLGPAVHISLDRAGRAVGGLALGHGAAVGLGRSLGGAAILARGRLNHRTVGLRLRLGDRAVRVGRGLGVRGGRTAATGIAAICTGLIHILHNSQALLHPLHQIINYIVVGRPFSPQVIRSSRRTNAHIRPKMAVH